MMARKLSTPQFVLAMAGMTILFAAIGHDNNAEWRMLDYARTLEAGAPNTSAASSKQECILEAWQRPATAAATDCSRYEARPARPDAVLAARDNADKY